jgi:hypothetical protein
VSGRSPDAGIPTALADVLAYSRLVLPAECGSREVDVLAAMEGFCRARGFRVLDLQPAADRVVRQTCAAVGQKIIDIPPGMTTAERAGWIAARMAKLKIGPHHG